MKKAIPLLVCFVVASFFSLAQTAVTGPELTKALQQPGAGWQRVTLLLEDQLDFQSMLYQFEADQTPLEMRAKTVLHRSQTHAYLKQAPLLARLHQMQGVRQIRSFWLVNMIELEVLPTQLSAVQQLTGIRQIERSDALTFALIPPAETSEVPLTEALNGREPGLTAIGAPFMWNLGYTGRNRRAMLFDTGVWPRHPAFSGRFLGDRLGNQQAWLGFDRTVPGDKPGTHGTHVIGTMLGLDALNNDTIGAAMNAYFIATDPIVENIADVRNWPELVLPFQWALNPDGDTSTTHDIPDVINNSWGRYLTDTSVCSGVVAQVIAAVEAAGIANVFSAGNEGPGGQTIGSPAQISLDTLSIFSVAAIDQNNNIAGFSSRGPTRCATDSRTAIKPEVSAPGVNIRSANGTNGYGQKSGTSMASPHVSGAVLLLKEAFPEVSGRQILNALYQTATDLGQAGEDNTYGMGMISLPAAYAYLAQINTPVLPVNGGLDIQIAGLMNEKLELCYNWDFPIAQDFNLNLLVENKGTLPVSQLQIEVMLGSIQQNFTIQQPLAVGQKDTLFLPAIQLPATGQQHDLKVRILPQAGETDTINNHWVQKIFFPEPSNFWLQETFDPANGLWEGWQIENPQGDGVFWDTISRIGAPFNTETAVVVRLRESSSRLGQLDYLYSPPVTISAVLARQQLPVNHSFSVAYNNRNAVFKDSLFVEINYDCDLSWRRIYSNGGDSLKTYTLNTPSQPAHWRNITIMDSVPYNPGSNPEYYRIRFVTKNDLGGNIYLTNISSMGLGGSVFKQTSFPLKIYPNPAKDMIFVETEDVVIQRLVLTDLRGKLQTVTLSDETSGKRLHLEGLAKGMYLLQVHTTIGIRTEKIMIQ